MKRLQFLPLVLLLALSLTACGGNGGASPKTAEPLTEEERERLSAAVRAGQIVFFLAMWETQAVGLCSVSPCFSTFACGEVGSFEDFYLEPDFRGKGAARLLAQAARDWCREEGIASLTVTCAPCDEGMYRALGFDTPLGRTLAHLTEG